MPVNWQRVGTSSTRAWRMRPTLTALDPPNTLPLETPPAPPFDPGAFPYQKVNEPVRLPIRATAALMMAACVLGQPPIPYSPSASGHPYPTFPDFARGKRRNPAALSQQACAFVEPAEFEKAVHFNANADQLVTVGAPASLPLSTADTYSVKSLFYVPHNSSVARTWRVIWCLENTTTFNHILFVDQSDNLRWFDNNVNGQTIGQLKRGVWYYCVAVIGTAGTPAVTFYWGRVGDSPTTYNLSGSPNVGWTPDRFTVGAWAQDTVSYFDGRLTGVQLWGRQLSLTDATYEVQRAGPSNFTNLIYDWRLRTNGAEIHAPLANTTNGNEDPLTGSWEELRGPFTAFNPALGFPWPQPVDPVRPKHQTRPSGSVFVYAPVAAPPWNPSTGHPYPSFPDFPSRKAKAPVVEGGATFLNTFPAPALPDLSWESSFPDFTRRLPQPLNVGGLFWTHLEREPSLDWQPDFPDFARGPRRPVNQGGEARTHLEREPSLDWQPDFPDFARGKKPLPILGGSFWTHLEREPDVDWLPTFADFARGRKPLPILGGEARTHLEREPSLDWQPDFPDFARGARRPVGEGGLFWTHLEREPSLDWLPVFADFARSLRPLVNAGFSVSPIQDREPDVDWLPTFVDFARGKKPLPILGGSFWTHLEREPSLDWQPDFPDFARGKRLAHEGVNGSTLFTPPALAPLLSWLPSFPDFTRSWRRAVIESSSRFEPPQGRQPSLDWLSTYPDFFIGSKRPLEASGAKAPPLVIPSYDLGWLPNFADFAGRRPPQSLNVGGSFWTHLEREPDVDWLPTFVDFARGRKPLPILGGEAAFVAVPGALISQWLSSYPDFARALRPTTREGGSGPLVLTDFHKTLAWAPSFPDFARAPKRPLNTGGLLLVLVDRTGPLYVFKMCGTLNENTTLVGQIRSSSIEGVLPVSYASGTMRESSLEGRILTTYITVVLDEGHIC